MLLKSRSIQFQIGHDPPQRFILNAQIYHPRRVPNVDRDGGVTGSYVWLDFPPAVKGHNADPMRVGVACVCPFLESLRAKLSLAATSSGLCRWRFDISQLSA